MALVAHSATLRAHVTSVFSGRLMLSRNRLPPLRGSMEAYQLGGRIVIPRAEVDAYRPLAAAAAAAKPHGGAGIESRGAPPFRVASSSHPS
jgi:hypothetical protein